MRKGTGKAQAKVGAWDQETPLEETPELLADLLPKFRAALSPNTAGKDHQHPPDSELLRFLRGCKYNPTKAAKRYNNYLTKRQELFPGQALHGKVSLDPEDHATLQRGFLRIMPQARDHGGRQLLLMMPARIKLVGDKDPQRIARAVFYTMEICLVDIETQRRGITMINDYAGMSRSNFSPDVIKEVSHVVQDCLPVRVGNILINNQGMMFSIFFKIVRLFIKEKLRKRIVLLGTNREALQQFIAPDVTPKQLGGQFEVPEPVALTTPQ